MRLFLAFDGGATTTRGGVYDGKRALLAEEDAEPSNPSEYGVGRCVSTLTKLARHLTQDSPGEIAVVAGGIAGAANPSLRDEIAHALCTGLKTDRVAITDDLRPVLLANAGQAPAILVVAGTGSAVLAQAGNGRQVVVGGRGTVFGDEGSAYQLAVTALRDAGRAVDGMAPDTGLVSALTEAAGLCVFTELTAWTHSASKRQIAELAKTVTTLAQNGDQVAQKCVEVQAENLAAQVIAASDRLSLPGEAPVYLSGGLLERCPLFRRGFETALKAKRPDMRPCFPRLRGHRAVLELAMTDAPPDGVSINTKADLEAIGQSGR